MHPINVNHFFCFKNGNSRQNNISKRNQENKDSDGNQKNVIQGKDQAWKIDVHNKENKITKIIHTK